jgi:uncharacterized 2Fe-2S/4Fe-4S cluster protein (DUF4445 family)
MNHLFLGFDVRPLATGPFLAANRQGLICDAGDLGLVAGIGATVMVLPNISGFVGADTVGVALATDILEAHKLTLAVDIGTNGELLLGTRKRLLATSCATGPALEGARISQGMGAADGAIDHIDIVDGKVVVSVLGDVDAVGICGSGLIDMVACLVKAGIVDSTGRMLERNELPELPESLAGRLRVNGSGPYFVFVEAPMAVRLTQRDVREFQLAKAAIAAATHILLKEYGAEVGDIHEVLLAGAFGNYIRKESALLVGLLPAVAPEKVKFIGNAASAGAKRVLLEATAMELAETISTRAEFIELGGRADFQAEFVDRIMF